MGTPKDEYMDASSNVRHWSTLRFAQLTIYIALMGGLLNIIYGKSSPLSFQTGILLKIAGLLLTFLFWNLQERTMLYWYNFVRRAAELEETLGFRQYSNRPRAGFFSSRNGMRLLFLIMALIWAAALLGFGE
jgi:hypothetical protein